MAVGIVLLATAGFTLLSNAAAASMPSSSSRSRQGSSSTPPRSSSYTATGVQTDAPTPIDANLHPAVLRTQRLHPQGDLGVSYIGDPPDTGEAISRAELFAMMLRKEVNPATRHATPKKQRRIVPSVKETSQRRGSPAPRTRSRLSYVKTVSFVPFPFYGFGYGLHHYSPWTYYSPLGR